MGDFYELRELAGVYYLEYQNENSGWNSIAVELEPEQYFQISEFTSKQEKEKQDFLANFLKGMKNV